MQAIVNWILASSGRYFLCFSSGVMWLHLLDPVISPAAEVNEGLNGAGFTLGKPARVALP